METNTTCLLRNHNLRVTNCRKDILSLFLNNQFALCQSFLEDKLPDHYNRVTIYRNLHAFEKNGLIHKVLDDLGTLRYALCGSMCKEVHNHDHVHFKCRICGKTQCIESVNIPFLKLPKGFIAEEYGLLVTGICKNCSSS